MKFERLSKDEYLKVLDEYESYIAALEFFRGTIKQKLSRVKGSFSDYMLESNLDKVLENRNNFIKQQNCMHHRTTGLQCVGHDSHKDHYEDKCIDCGVVLTFDSV